MSGAELERAARQMLGTVRTAAGEQPAYRHMVTADVRAVAQAMLAAAAEIRRLRDAVAAEREACALAAEKHEPEWAHLSAGEDYIAGNPMEEIAAAIRARGAVTS